MARFADIAAIARATVGHIIRYISGGAVNEMPNRQYLDFSGNCTVNDDGVGIRVTIPEVPAGSVQVGQVETLPAGSMAYVTNSGTEIHAILNFGIPRGDPSTDIQSIPFGGTGASTAEGARENLSVPSLADLNAVASVAVKTVDDQSIAGIKTFTSSPVVPTAMLGDNSTKTANTAFVATALAAVNGTVVHLAGNEVITGNKTFTGTVTLPENQVLPSSTVATTQALTDDSTKVATTAWVRDYIDQKLAEIYYYQRNGS